MTATTPPVQTQRLIDAKLTCQCQHTAAVRATSGPLVAQEQLDLSALLAFRNGAMSEMLPEWISSALLGG